MLVYEDKTWEDRLREELAPLLEEFLERLAELESLIRDWLGLLERLRRLIEAQQGGTLARRQDTEPLLTFEMQRERKEEIDRLLETVGLLIPVPQKLPIYSCWNTY